MIQPINTNQNSQTRQNNPNQGYFAVPYTMLPQGERNYCLFNQNKVDFIVSQGVNGVNVIPYLEKTLQTSTDEKEIVETLYIIDRMIDKGVKGIPAMYPALAKFNYTDSPNIQAFLAGIYRKTQVPDAFGPLVSMLIRNSNNYLSPQPLPLPKHPPDVLLDRVARVEGATFQPLNPSTLQPFDPNEEIGGAILEYIKNYSNNPKKIDYTI